MSTPTSPPIGPPSAPRDLKVTDTSQSAIAIEWKEPDNTGGVHLTGYIIEMCTQDESQFSLVGMVAGSQMDYEAIGLKENEGYKFRVRARNIVGVSEQPAEIGDPVVAKMPFGMFCNHRHGASAIAWSNITIIIGHLQARLASELHNNLDFSKHL